MAKVFVVEDDPYIQLLITRKLQEAGMVVQSASNGADAMVRVLAEIPDVLILDVMLPDRSGLEICRDVKEQLGVRCPPVLIVSANGQAADVRAARAVGADDYLIKPFATSELLESVERLLRR